MNKVDYQNTYNFDQFTDIQQKEELERLQKQAMLVSALEQPIIKKVGIPDSGTLVDIGCGPGFVTAEIARSNQGVDVIGIDTSDELLEVANNFTAAGIDNLSFRNGDAYSSGFDNDSVDFIYSRLLYQHLEHPEKALEESKRILRPGGKVCVMDVDDTLQIFYPELPSFHALQMEAHKQQVAAGGDRRIGRKLPTLMEQAGLKNIRCNVEGMTTLDIGFEAFFNIVVSFKAQIVGKKGEDMVAEIENDIAALEKQPFGMVVVPVAIGEV
jgi:SAM-dependent methyltransferase|tara:strand:- start:355 stop:1161 length:807 start_codon:yes stop_codon:yes gene_type:complete